MKKILCTTDFSENSKKALIYAHHLSKLFNSKLVVLHVYDIPTILSGPANASTADEISNGVIKENLEKLCSICEKELGFNNDNLRYEVKENNSSVKGIITMIDETQADLVVMGVKGASNLREVVMGSTSMGVIRKASCPVITIPTDAVTEPIIKKIAYATDLNENNFNIINGLKEIAIYFDAELSVVHISTDSEQITENKLDDFQKKLSEQVSYNKLHFEVLHSNNITKRLYSYVSEENISIIAMFEHENKSIFDKWFKTDLVKAVELHTKIPMISFNQHFLNLLLTTKKS
ncbi:MAG: universal stress protein [Bacteroidota bacterium]